MNKAKNQFLIICAVFLLVSFAQLHAVDVLSGRVYKGASGTEPPVATALSGVTVRLYGSNNAGTMGISIGTTTTNSVGWFGLTAIIGFEYYTLVESDPSGYYSVGASSVSGTVLNNNQIRFSRTSSPLSSQTLTGNKFWDKPDTPVNNPPVADANGPYSGLVGQSITLDGSGSYDLDPGDHIVSYHWDLDMDGQYDDATGKYAQHTWHTVYSGNIQLRVTDSHGGADSDQAIVTISRGQPEIDIRGNGISISNGDMTPSHADWTQMGSKEIKTGSITRTFYIHNTGSDTLFLTDIRLNPDTHYQSGSLAASFGIIPASLKVAPGSSVPLGVELYLYQTGTWGTTLIIENNDADEDPYTFYVQGKGSESTSPQYDYGDAPDPTYPTLLSNNGARHEIDPDVYLGSQIDPDPNGQPNAGSSGDDTDGTDDEDGVVIKSALITGSHVNVEVTASIAGILNAWVDFDRDGSWGQAPDQVFSDAPLAAGKNNLSFSVPGDAIPGVTAARFRFNRGGNLSYEGEADDGEVEDYLVEIDEGAPLGSITIIKSATPQDSSAVFNFTGDLGAFSLTVGSNTKSFIDHPPGTYAIQEVAQPDWVQGNFQIAGDLDGGTTFNATTGSISIDLDAGEDIFLIIYNTKKHDVAASVGDFVWNDLNKNGLQEPGEPGIGGVSVMLIDQAGHVLATTQTDPWGFYQFTHVAPASYSIRFVLKPGYAFSPTGMGNDDAIDSDAQYGSGETQLFILMAGYVQPDMDAGMYQSSEMNEYDFGDAPDSNASPGYPTLLANNGARHAIQPGYYLGKGIDGEPDGMHSALADGDDLHGFDDEDGVSISPFIAPGQAVPLTIVASDTGVVNAWLDFNMDGDWADAGEHFIAAQPLVPGANSFTLIVPGGIMPGLTYARFRFSSIRQLSYNGPAPDGEVEDYALEIVEGDEGSVIIVKEATPEDNTTFWFCTQLSSGFFHLFCDYLEDPSKDRMTILNPDQVLDITESSVPGWTLTDITVTGDVDNGSTIDIANNRVDLDYDDGEHIVITFKNQKTGSEDQYDFGDAPDPTYPTLLASNGARHIVSPGLYLGSGIDPEPEGQASPKADGDDQNAVHPGSPFPPGDEEGVLLPSLITAGQSFSIQVTSFGGGVLNAWLDFNIDGDWADAGEHIIPALPLSPGMNAFMITVPGDAQAGQSYARFRLSSVRDISYEGPAPDGEVEDYEIFIDDEGGDFPPVKWKQAPLLTEDPEYPFAPCFMGWDEYSVYTERIVADDWFCSDPRPVTDIHWWGSYMDWDSVAAPEHAPHAFHIGVWTDAPATDHLPRSHPGELVWEWHVPRDMLHERPVGNDFVPGRMEKPDTCFQYDFFIPEDQWFVQEDDSAIYWLSIAAMYEVVPDSFIWGWKTRQHYFRSDAVSISEPKVLGIGTVAEVAEPVDEWWDVSFVLTTNEHATEFDFGDAPDHRYPTLLGQNGAHHIFNPDVFLGAGVDPEVDGQPEQASMGDDQDGNDDEDGVIFLSELKPGSPVRVEVNASTSGFLNAWMDFNNNGTWADPDEQIFMDEALLPGTNLLTFTMPANGHEATTFSRFRFSREAHIPYFGLAMDGEVEDYYVDVDPVVNFSGREPEVTGFSLMQNFPNPFDSNTEILYEIPQEEFVRLTIYDLSGKAMAVLVNEQRSPGRHLAQWDGKDHHGQEVSEGMYFYRFEAGDFRATRKLLRLK